ncbi:MAG TPA: DUF5675 family protein [Candidatus Limnocylindrales bacterium]|nr:DUF5675 family protein [Candidatus Limnocylindrales bacterium]
MNLYLIRNIYTPTSTIGDLIIKNLIFCHTLEDVTRHQGAVKVPGKTAIAAGRYAVTVTMSNRFKRMMPILADVPDFEGIRMHGGNTPENTEGCILVAKNIVNCHTVFGSMEKELTDLLTKTKERHWIEIVNTFPYTGTP